MAHQTFPKVKADRKPAKIERRIKKLERKHKEDLGMAKARRRDKRCRFPLCGCRTFGIVCDVSHVRHRGMGGNPSGDRSASGLLMLLCRTRHKEGKIAIDKGTLEWRPLTKAGSDGPVAWYVDAEAMHLDPGHFPDGWIEVAREIAIGVCEPLTPYQRSVLLMLAEMTT